MNIRVDEAELVRALADGIKSPGYPDRVGYYQYTYSGRVFFPLDPRPEEVFVEDIAAGCARQGRFNGQTKKLLTVAEHQYIASFMVPKELALEAHVHDGAEGYIGDKIRTLKMIPRIGEPYQLIERGIERAIAERFGLRHPWPAEVMKADEALGLAEIEQNIASQERLDKLWSNGTIPAPSTTQLFFWEPEMARIMWLGRFYELAKERGIEVF